MCMACNNRLCGVCHRRFGAHRVGDDACPGDEPGTFRATTFEKWKPEKTRPHARDRTCRDVFLHGSTPNNQCHCRCTVCAASSQREDGGGSEP